jgi:hypothetical protein
MAEEAENLLQAMQDLQIPEDQARAAAEAGRGRGSPAEQFAAMAAGKLEQLAGLAETAAGNCSGQGGSCPSMSPSQFAQSIEQMLRAMQGGGGLPDRLPEGLRLGGGGIGMGGMHSVLGMIGPQFPSRGGNSSGFELPGRSMGDGTGPSVSEITPEGSGPGRVTPERTRTEPGAASRIPGIPVRYRPLVEAYFERLAKDRVQE